MQDTLLKHKSVTLSLANREEVAESRISFGNSITSALRDAIIKQQTPDAMIRGVYFRLKACALPGNHWVADDLHNEATGELYAGNGILKACGSKLCPSCVAKAANRSRNELKLALKNQKLFVGESYKFITLTIPNPNLSLLKTRVLLNRTWELFRKREFYIKHFRGGSKSEEFTITENGYHYHYHLFCIARFLSFEKLRTEWTSCAEIAHREANAPFEVNNSDGLLSVVVKSVNSSNNSLKGAIQEVAKYVTKSDSWEKIPQKDLLEIASIKRFPRMFELLGYFREQRNANAVLSFRHPIITYLLLNLALQVLKKLKEIIENGDADTILDTKQISDGKDSSFDEYSGVSPPNEVKKRQRNISWREHIEVFGLEDYLKRLTLEVETTWEYRRTLLRQKYPFATFKTMDGETF